MGEATNRLIDEITNLLRQATIGDLVALSQGSKAPTAQPEAPRAEEPTSEPEATPSSRSGETAAKKTPTTPRKTRSWPTCSTPGCTGKMYGPSGRARFCYQHHLEAGGKPSPFSRKRSKADEADEGPQPAVEARQGAEKDPDGPGEREGVQAAKAGPESGLEAGGELRAVQEPGPARAGAETPVAAPAGTSPPHPAPRRSIKEIRRSAVDPSVVVRKKGLNGRSADAGSADGALGEAEALFDLPGSGRGR